MKTVKLRNGKEEFEPLVRATMLSLNDKEKLDPVGFYELVMKARDHNHQFFGNTAERLKKTGLLDDRGGIHDSIRNIILSAVVGDGLDMTLQEPYAE